MLGCIEMPSSSLLIRNITNWIKPIKMLQMPVLHCENLHSIDLRDTGDIHQTKPERWRGDVWVHMHTRCNYSHWKEKEMALWLLL